MPRRSNQNQTQENGAENSREALTFQAAIREVNPERGILATADVKIGDLITVRNVKIKEDDYGLNVTMPRTKMPYTGQYKDSVIFANKEIREQFDQAVAKVYQASVQDPVLEDAGLDEEGVNEQEEVDEQEEDMQMGMGM